MPNEPIEVQGVMQAHAWIAPDGRRYVIFEWPDGQCLYIERDECVLFGLLGLQVASRLFPSAAELGEKINYARSQIMDLQPISFQ